LAERGSFSFRREAPRPEGLSGAPVEKGFAYTGPFGPAFGWQPDQWHTELIIPSLGAARVAWGESGVRRAQRKTMRAGVQGEIGGSPLVVSRDRGGLSRERRALRIAFEDRRYVYRLRGWDQHRLDRDDIPVIERRGYWDGGVLDAADAADVAVFVILQASHLEREVELRTGGGCLWPC